MRGSQEGNSETHSSRTTQTWQPERDFPSCRQDCGSQASWRNKPKRRDGLPRMATGKEINVMYPSVFLFNLHKKGCQQPWGDSQYVMHTVSTSSGLINSRICELTGRCASYRMATPFHGQHGSVQRLASGGSVHCGLTHLWHWRWGHRTQTEARISNMLEGGPHVEAGEGNECQTAMSQVLRQEGTQSFLKAESFCEGCQKNEVFSPDVSN